MRTRRSRAGKSDLALTTTTTNRLLTARRRQVGVSRDPPRRRLDRMQRPSRREFLHAALAPERDPLARLVDQDPGVDVCRSRGPNLRKGDSPSLSFPFLAFLLLELATPSLLGLGRGLDSKVTVTDVGRSHSSTEPRRHRTHDREPQLERRHRLGGQYPFSMDAFATFGHKYLSRPDTNPPLLTTRHRTRLSRTGSSMAGRREPGRRRAT